MSRIIYKYAITPADGGYNNVPPFVASVMMPSESEVVRAAKQHGTFVVWALVEKQVPTTQQKFFLVLPTGVEIPVEYQFSEYIDIIFDDSFVWHVFDCTYAYEKQEAQKTPDSG